ncbi:MAG: hypothetical protein KAR13_17865 [Desulfobulbaceae bacterium]|nr:hypothetical protein [Desulfobulbaceae bacterium]
MTSTSNIKVTLMFPPHHKWLNGLRGSSLVIEHLLDGEFGTEIGVGEDADRIAAEKIVKALKIIENMRRSKKQKKRNDPPYK